MRCLCLNVVQSGGEGSLLLFSLLKPQQSSFVHSFCWATILRYQVAERRAD